MRREVAENEGIEQQNKTQSRILDACFYGQSPSVSLRQFEWQCGTITDTERQQVMNENNKEYVLDAF